jgi:hypothetical protein
VEFVRFLGAAQILEYRVEEERIRLGSSGSWHHSWLLRPFSANIVAKTRDECRE